MRDLLTSSNPFAVDNKVHADTIRDTSKEIRTSMVGRADLPEHESMDRRREFCHSCITRLRLKHYNSPKSVTTQHLPSTVTPTGWTSTGRNTPTRLSIPGREQQGQEWRWVASSAECPCRHEADDHGNRSLATGKVLATCNMPGMSLSAARSEHSPTETGKRAALHLAPHRMVWGVPGAR